MYYLETKITVPTSLESCWNFFCSPKNLALITPEEMSFKIQHPSLDELDQMYEGMLISYTVKPILGIKMNWVTEISKIEKGKFFIDEQRIGPYKMWHHEHHFEETEDGIFMTDKLSYVIPMGILGKIAHSLFVKKQMEKIFSYRERKIKELFAKKQ